MALPKINSIPEYELVIPSTQKKVKYRPFVVKEQKVLLIALESQDQRQIINAISNTIDACINSDIKVQDLTTFDLEYMFTQIRARSVGEKSRIKIKCTECSEFNEIVVDLLNIAVSMPPNKSSSVKLTDKISIKLKYPSQGQIEANPRISEIKTQTELLMEMLLMSLDSLQTEEENILFKDEPYQEIVSFIDSLTSPQLDMLVNWVTELPVMKHSVKFDCASCNHHNNITLQGLTDFFS